MTNSQKAQTGMQNIALSPILGEHLTISPATATPPADDLAAKLAACRIDPSKHYAPPPFCIEINGQGTMPLRGLTVIKGKAKSRKTTALSLLAAVLGGADGNGVATATYQDDRRGILWFDTEQADYDAVRTARLFDANLAYYAISEMDKAERIDLIEYAMQHHTEAFLVVIDGARDLVRDFNSVDESDMLAAWITALAKKHNVHICTVMHQNKADGNMRGHLGAELCNKATTVWEISITDNPDISRATCTEARQKAPADFGIDWSGERPVLIEMEAKRKPGPAAEKAGAREKALDALTMQCIVRGGKMPQSDAVVVIQRACGASERTSKTYLAELITLGKVFQDPPKKGEGRAKTIYITDRGV